MILTIIYVSAGLIAAAKIFPYMAKEIPGSELDGIDIALLSFFCLLIGAVWPLLVVVKIAYVFIFEPAAHKYNERNGK